jgi:small subunit ribosomal protein S17
MEKTKVKTQRAVVIGKSGDKTIKVQIDFLARHPKYGKFMRRRTRLAVHDPGNIAGVGDVVDITECRPISKNKSWRLMDIVQKAVVE